MKWLVCCLMFPLSATAASVLLIPVDEKARALADDLIDPFAAAKLTVKTAGPGSPGLSCLKAGDRDGCLGTLGEKAKVVAVFIVTGAMKGPRGTLTLEMLARGVVLKKSTTRVTRGKVSAQMEAPIATLLKLLPASEPGPAVETPKATVTQKVKDSEEPPEREPDPPKLTDAPKKVEPVALTPQKPADPLALKTTAPRTVKPKVAAWVVTGLAIAAAGTAATLGGLGLAGKGRLEAAPNGQSALSYSDAVALQSASNTQLSVALGTGIGAGVTGVVAAILWGVE